jgi:type II secretory pathway pseudopilin PulG
VTTTKKRKLSPVAMSAAIGGVILAVLAAGLFLVVLPQKNKAADIGKEILATRDQIVQARALATQKPAQPIRVASLFKLVKAMPDGADMTGIVLQLNQTATDAGIEFDTIAPGVPLPGAGYQKMPISLTFMGNYYGLTDFLFRLRSLVTVRGGALAASGRLFSVDSIEFGAGVGGFPMIAAKVSVSAYIYGGGVVAAPGAPAAPTDTTSSSTGPASTTPTTPTTPAPSASGVTN